MLHLPAISAIGDSWVILGVLGVILAASSLVYWALVRRWTVLGRLIALRDWAADNRLRFALGRSAAVPPPIDQLGSIATIKMLAADDARILSRFETRVTIGSANPGKASMWHVLIRPLPAAWAATGLRPVANAVSLLDFFQMSSFPSLIGTERFVVFGTDAVAARRLAESMTAALLPADVGLLLLDKWMVLDFSTRPFDPTELARMITLGQQLADHLPTAGSA